MNEIARIQDFTAVDRTMRSLAGRRWTTVALLDRIEAGLLDPDEDFELIHGEVVPMLRRGPDNENLRGDLSEFLIRHRRTANVRVSASPQFQLSDDTYRKPAIVVRPSSIPIPDVRGRDALLVIEISDTSLATDLRSKATFYASFGVREYWVIAARTRVTWVHREPSAAGYAQVGEVAPDQMLVPLLVPALAFRHEDVGLQDD